MKKILVVDDNTDVRENIAEILELANYNVFTAVDGKDGVQQAKDIIPDVILCDIMMPNLDGYGVLQILSHDPKTARIPFIYLSAKTEQGDIRKGMNLGADDYITKPFEETDLLQTIEARISRSEQLNSGDEIGEGQLDNFMSTARGLVSLQDLSQERKVKSFSKKSSVYAVDDAPRYLYLLKTGKVRIFQMNNDGKEMTTSLLKPGDYFGYEALLRDANHFDSAEVMEDSDIVLIPKEDFVKLITRNREVAARFIQMLSNNLEEKEKQLLDLAYKTVRKRVADALVTLCDKYKEEGKDFEMAISREDLASIVGTSTESAIRMLSEFKASGMVEIHGSSIRVLQPEVLRKAPY
jgi:CRP-like cAMP-binding protein/CheY-like chemotaxis protein